MNNMDSDKHHENSTFDAADPLYQLLEKQATELELCGQRLKSEIQNSYQEFIKLKQQQQKHYEITAVDSQRTRTQVTIDVKPGETIEKTSNDDVLSQSELINSLKFRIEELETDVIIRNQDIEKQNSEIQWLKKELSEFKNETEERESKRMKEIEELNDFKSNFMLLFDSFKQTVKELKSQNEIGDKIDTLTRRIMQLEMRSIDCVKDPSIDRNKIVSYTECGDKIAVGETYYRCQ
jgi:hypothetical protein